jgi:ElaB/YqjD/DUF883 family membrane-anchored ribosome-binding protein
MHINRMAGLVAACLLCCLQAGQTHALCTDYAGLIIDAIEALPEKKCTALRLTGKDSLYEQIKLHGLFALFEAQETLKFEVLYKNKNEAVTKNDCAKLLAFLKHNEGVTAIDNALQDDAFKAIISKLDEEKYPDDLTLVRFILSEWIGIVGGITPFIEHMATKHAALFKKLLEIDDLTAARQEIEILFPLDPKFNTPDFVKFIKGVKISKISKEGDKEFDELLATLKEDGTFKDFKEKFDQWLKENPTKSPKDAANLARIDKITLLHLACDWTLFDIVDFLIKQGADINKDSGQDGENTPLFEACRFSTDPNGLKTIKLLLDNKAIIDPKGADWSVLTKLYGSNNLAAVKLLVEHGANIEHAAAKEAESELAAAKTKAEQAVKEAKDELTATKAKEKLAAISGIQKYLAEIREKQVQKHLENLSNSFKSLRDKLK